MTWARVCGRCHRNWPDTSDWSRCPQCDWVTSRQSIGGKPTETADEARAVKREAKFNAAQKLFEQWLKDESDEERHQRRQRHQDALDQVDHEMERRAREIRKRFNQVLRSGGFSNADREVYESLEAMLPMAHLHNFTEPE